MKGMAFCDIGANLLSKQFRGRYTTGKQYHVPDLEAVLKRADAAGLREIIITAGTLRESREALDLARKLNASGQFTTKLHTTVGVHPTNAKQLDAIAAPSHTGSTTGTCATGAPAGAPCDTCGPPAGGEAVASHSDSDDGNPGGGPHGGKRALSKEEYIAELHRVVQDGMADGTVVAIGECGLDYDRLFFSPKESQLAHFPLHFDLAERYGLPLFLHDRNTGGDFAAMMKANRHRIPGGVVHSFTGTSEELQTYLDVGLDIGE